MACSNTQAYNQTQNENISVRHCIHYFLTQPCEPGLNATFQWRHFIYFFISYFYILVYKKKNIYLTHIAFHLSSCGMSSSPCPLLFISSSRWMLKTPRTRRASRSWGRWDREESGSRESGHLHLWYPWECQSWLEPNVKEMLVLASNGCKRFIINNSLHLCFLMWKEVDICQDFWKLVGQMLQCN